MRKACVIAGIMAIFVAPKSPLQAGLYHPALPAPSPEISPEGVKPIPFARFRRDVLEDLLKVGTPQPSEIGNKFLKARDELLTKARSGALTEEDQVNLSGLMIRLRQYQEAIDLLTPIATRDCRNFMVFANLATAEQQAGQIERAVSHLEQALKVWPQQWPGLSMEQLRWYHQAEKYHLNLARYRWTHAPQGAQPQTNVDPLFPPSLKEGQPVRYVGDSGQYEAGKIAAVERAKLSPDALAIIQQLLIWLPDDPFLYWQYGELLNATGDVTSAAQVFDDCVGRRRMDAPELRQHRRIVEEAKASLQDSTLTLEDNAPTASGSDSSWLPARNKLWIAGIVFGLVAIILVYFQIREMRRRRSAAISRK
jgi:tetratricopeptide (TPR) repeat protein